MECIVSILLLLLANKSAGYLVPSPLGKYNVTLTTGSLVDYSRNDQYAATPTPRALMLSVFQPATCNTIETVPYMPRKTANYQGPWLENYFNISYDLTPIFRGARLPVCPICDTTISPLDDQPILLFSPGFSIPRLYYNVIASAIASEGFMVITIDHPSDANIIVYPDGETVYGNDTIWSKSNPTRDEYPRAADASFVIDQLSNATAIAELLPQRGPIPFPTDRIAMLGHSLGGASAIIAAGRDDRIRAAINWDGTIFGLLPATGVSQPVLILSHSKDPDPSWLRVWPRLTGPKLLADVANTTHETFSDVPTLLQASGQNSGALDSLLGTIAPAQMVRILAASTTVWMNGAFASEERALLLQGVSTLKKGNL